MRCTPGDDARMSAMDAEHREGQVRTPPGRLTYEDFLLFPDDGQRHELIDGEHYVTPSPNIRHQTLSRRPTRALLAHQEAHPGGELFYAPLDCVPTDMTTPLLPEFSLLLVDYFRRT